MSERIERPRQWLTTTKAAERLGVSPRRLLRFIDEGSLPAYNVGNRMRLSAADVDQARRDGLAE